MNSSHSDPRLCNEKGDDKLFLCFDENENYSYTNFEYLNNQFKVNDKCLILSNKELSLGNCEDKFSKWSLR